MDQAISVDVAWLGSIATYNFNVPYLVMLPSAVVDPDATLYRERIPYDDQEGPKRAAKGKESVLTKFSQS